MKKFLTLIYLCLLSLSVNAQQKSLNEITSFKIKNLGAMMDKNNDVDGYYLYYQVDKLKKGKREYAIKILDNNLNDIATKSYIDNKNTFLLQGKFNNQALMFAMANSREEYYKLVMFDREGNQGESVSIDVDKKEIEWLLHMRKTGNFNTLLPVDNKGFLFNYIKDNKKLGYGLKYVSTDGGASWDYNSPEDIKKIMTINPIEVNEKVVVAIEGSKKSMLSKTITFKVLVIDIKTGKLLFEREFERENNPRLISNAFLTDNKEVVLLGEYFKNGDNIYKDESLGLFAQINSLDGKIISDSKIGWKNEIDNLMPKKDEDKRGYIYFHNIVRTQNGSYYFIGEKYKKTISVGSVALGVLSRGANGGANFTIGNTVIFEFDKSFNIKGIKEFEKGKSVFSGLGFGGPQMQALIAKASGSFDYVFTQIDTDRDRFYANFIDYERLKGEKNKLAFKTIIYNKGKFSEDKIYLQKDSGKIKFRVLQGKLGHVMLMEYNKKEKTLDLHLEKLNIQ
ncbi:DUF6770 family protein [Jejuia spongiicola]|uniref:Exo-alpha-sialidase n=1 Tax=Jejuia spongiicola TaxID=2942207 RepID=A0ABT0QEY3_9FLAO|nr:DUF6770 family protein [Jejuia spongiicola]MCL6295556.1 hypothetical protein [Jejuia spongiicola]